MYLRPLIKKVLDFLFIFLLVKNQKEKSLQKIIRNIGEKLSFRCLSLLRNA
jgi:hypothetical protein